MAEELKAHLAVRDVVEDHPTRSLSPWSLIENDNPGSSYSAAQSRETTRSLSNKECDKSGTDCALSPSALEHSVFNESMLRAMPESNQAVSLSPNFTIEKIV